MLFYHSYELEQRLKFIILSYLLSFFIVYSYSEYLLLFITPVELFFTHITQTFTSYLKFSFYLSFYINFPYLFWNIAQFLKAGLFDYEWKNLKWIIFTYNTCFILIMVFVVTLGSLILNIIMFNINKDWVLISYEGSYFISLIVQLINIVFIINLLLVLSHHYKLKLTRRHTYLYILIFISLFVGGDLISIFSVTLFCLLQFEIMEFIYTCLNKFK